MKERTSHTLYTYWNEVRGERIAPRRFEIEPSRIAAILPETFILERIGRADYQFRLAGTRVCDQFGREFRGLNMLDVWSAEDREIVVRLLESVTREGAVAEMTIEATTPSGRATGFELLLLPLVHAGNDITRILGNITATTTPPWLGEESIAATRITAFNLIWPDGRPHAIIERMDRQQPFAKAPRHSRIVRSDRRSFRVYDGGRDDV